MIYCPRCEDRYGRHNILLVRDWPNEPLHCLTCGYRDEPVSTAPLVSRHLQSNRVKL
jgi:hypothetical protein